ncbi:hypothetical protein BC332_25927 [Capsicum chinense]|nr:hypothetical protein BC332_25927 [Capsicum chinense]
MVNWKVVKPKPRYKDLMDDMFSKLVYRNITPSPQELNHLDFPNPLMFGLTDDAANVAQYQVHESEKGNLNIELDPPQSVNEHTTDVKIYNIVDATSQSSKLGVNEGANEESLKKAESSYADKLQEDDRHITDAEVVKAIMKERIRGLWLVAAYAEFLSNRHQIPSSEFDLKKHRTRYTSFLWDYGGKKACTGYVSDNQDPPKPKRTFIRSEDTEMIDVEP